ncbi:eukaryotic translation initiation factor-like protein 2C 2 [Xylogone sp. PMI_703]|nr:eukaryotic translation initiation factor-like protein 2C 2 [Xylogone sp. PMI_703]
MGGVGRNRNRNGLGGGNGQLDGPGEGSSARGRSPAPGQPSPSHSRNPSQGSGRGGANPPPTPFGQGLGYDPAKPIKKQTVITNTRMELPPAAYALDNPVNFPSDLPLRPATNTVGKPVQLRVNQYKVTAWPEKDIYQYDILIGNGAEKKGKIMAVWNSKTVQARLKSVSAYWLWDGNKIAWCDKPGPKGKNEIRILVNLDEEKGRPSRNPPDTVYMTIKQTKVIKMAVIRGYLTRQMAFDSTVLEAINFLDHCIRQWPSENYTTVKRSFFSRGNEIRALDSVVEAQRGVYSSIRLCDPNASNGAKGTGLAINVDVANGTFWIVQDVHQAARNLCMPNAEYQRFRTALYPVRKNGEVFRSDAFKNLRKMSKLKFRVKHRGKADNQKTYTIKRFMFDPKYGPEGAHAKNVKFNYKDKATNRETLISVYDYFQMKYDIHLNFWYLPLIETEKAGTFPMEVCVLLPNQRYNFKLDQDQTAKMIKFAVTRPKERMAHINFGINMLKWHEDPYLNYYGIKVEPQMSATNARVLPNPKVHFDKAEVNPGTAGRWDLRGKKFLLNNAAQYALGPLKSWGFAIIGNSIAKPALQNFIKVFMQVYIGHGGVITNKEPLIWDGSGTRWTEDNYGEQVAQAHRAIGNQAKMAPQIIFYVLPDRNSFHYERLKKGNDCRFAVVSQMMQAAHVTKANPQYCSNVCMKVNAKLGGTTCKSLDAKEKANAAPFKVNTMIIGADVSHPSPGSPQGSMAALTMSLDANACRYAAAVQTNGHRVEMITTRNLKEMVIPLFETWIQRAGGGRGPSHIYYFRDGVSEGQFAHVLQQEVKDMKDLLKERFGAPAASVKWTVIVCTKRHHIRFFPKEGDMQSSDRNGNALPGTLVERDVTHPFEYDFYLSSHSAIQGTARPVHYQVILDEAKVHPNELQKMIYNSCYQYMRSTTPVSLHPAVYYAHLASNRARCQEDHRASDGARGGQKFTEKEQDDAYKQQYRAAMGQPTSSESGTVRSIDVKPLLPMGNPSDPSMHPNRIAAIRHTMWYI